jgi:(p)ppGpp synthase/HD superfamily hydrolase
MVFVLEVQDRQQLQRLINRLIQMEGVLGVSRH